MRIAKIFVQNFRKLKSVEFDMNENQTICVGANNSGKTTLMDAIMDFLAPDGLSKFKTRDFTLNLWDKINQIGESWMGEEVKDEDRSIDKWEGILPSLDIWISAEDKEAFKVMKLLPDLDWNGGLVGARVRLEPKLDNLFEDYVKAKEHVKALKETKRGKKHTKDDLYPRNLWDFLDHGNKLQKYFKLRYYVLDQKKLQEGIPQPTPSNQEDDSILKGLIRIDYIEAQRGFSDPNSSQSSGFDTLSRQLSKYYDSNGDPIENLTEEFLPLYEEINKLTESLNKQLDKRFRSPVNELHNINYPGFQNPSIMMNTKVNPKETLQQESAVLFNVNINNGKEYNLAEQYNGLGYRNLISMYFQLIHFRESWVNIKESEDRKAVEPIHLVLIEEPEAHLHAQAQQVFIAKALDALKNNDAAKKLQTQLIVSTHSTHIAHELDFDCLRYFKRRIDEDGLPVTDIINLVGTFGKDDETKKFVIRYMRLTHCDMFFADGIILVEGSGERILMPKFLENEGLSNRYISIIEINGAHAHRFCPLIEKLGMPTLIVTDLDSEDLESKEKKKKVRPERGKGYVTNNDTLKNWLPGETYKKIDDLLDVDDAYKQKGLVRVAYQHEVSIKYKGNVEKVIPYTLEDAVCLANIDLFQKEEVVQQEKRKKELKGMVKNFHDALNEDTIGACMQKLFDSLNNSQKAPYAIDLLFMDRFEKLRTPTYIKEGLKWLEDKISATKDNFK